MENYDDIINKRNKLKLSFMESDLSMKKEIIDKEDVKFIKSINDILNANEDLKKMFDEKEKQRLDSIKKDNTDENEKVDVDMDEDIDDSIELSEFDKRDKSDAIKKVYRKIVKKTHPDKVSDFKLNDLYMRASEFYEIDDIISLYNICDELDIEYELSEDYYSLIEGKIEDISRDISSIEQTFTWKWYTAETDDMKNRILVAYINNLLK